MSDDVAFTVEPERYLELLAAKIEALKASLGEYTHGLDFTSILSEPIHYRLRCRFDVAELDGKLTYVMWNHSTTPKVYLTQFPAATKRINSVMTDLLRELQHRPALRQSLVMANFLGTLNTNDVVITLVYDSKVLGPDWTAEAHELQRAIQNASIVGRCRGSSTMKHPRFWDRQQVIGNDFVTENLHLNDGRVLIYRQPEGSFSNPNGAINTRALEWLSRAAQNIAARSREKNNGKVTDLLEMYCGNGNHTVCLSKFFHRVLAVEINPDLVSTARHNLSVNGCENATVLQVPSERFSRDILRTRRYMDAEEGDIDVGGYDFGAVLVDPPRGGLDKATLKLLRTFEDILYIR